jgi:Rrf2 family protein
MFSQTTQYAIRAVVMLAYEDNGGPLGNTVLASRAQIPPSYLSKVLQGLARAGVVESRRGVGGGFRLVKSAAEITLLDVVNAVDPIPRIKGCPLRLKSHATMLCSVHARLDQAMAQVENVLSEATIADLISEPSRPRPLMETPAFLTCADRPCSADR